VARINEGSLGFVFRKNAHDRGEKLVLGEVFPPQQGEAEGLRLLDVLARHPATAKHLARRLCARLVTDEPPESCVSSAAAAYTRSDGDIREVLRAIVKDAAFWATAARGRKLKTPLELMASAARALEAKPDGSLALSEMMAALGEPLLQERVPTGYPDSEREWASGGGMLVRMSFASELGAGNVRGLDIPWEETFPSGADVSASAAKLGESLLGLPGNSRTLQVIREQLESVAEPKQRRAVAVALLVGSPEFQRQ
jgi:uncharacterized protein (DUF1800 family)